MTTEDTEFTEEGKGGFLRIRVFHMEQVGNFCEIDKKFDAIKRQGRAVSLKGKGVCAEAGVAQF